MKKYPLIVIGAGAGGLVIAIGAAKAGKKVLLIEKGTYGGDCTHFGCIPSKSLIASAHAAHSIREANALGIDISPTLSIDNLKNREFDKEASLISDSSCCLWINANRSLERARKIVAEIESHELPEALKKWGVDTITAKAFFKNPHEIIAGEEEVFGKQIVIATGSSPLIPPIKGLDQTPFLTNETIFDLKEIPESLIVVGGGPIGCELAQAFQRLGSKVTIIHSHSELLGREDIMAQNIIAKQFEKEGISLFLGMRPAEVLYQKNQFRVLLDNGGTLEAKALLVCIGRKPHVAGLNLDEAGVKYSEKGISVDKYGRTHQRHIWAVGDVTGAPFFTHWAEYQARAVLTSILLPLKKKRVTQAIPRVTFTDPEVASVGMSEEEAAKKYKIASYVVPFSSIDRAITASRTEGSIKIVTKKWSSKILGCTIVGPRAGEMLGEITLAMKAGIPLRKLADLIHPYPTYAQAIRKAADMWLTQTILGVLKRKKS